MSEITIQDLTVGTLNGDGVFDELMHTVNVYVQQEYSKGRIQGTEYANLYLGGLQSSMAQAIQFLLGRQTADKQADLLDAQRDQVLAEINKIAKEEDLIDQQILKMKSDIELTNQQIAISIVQEQNLKEEQKKIIEETKLIGQNYNNAVISATNLLKQQAKIDAETDLLRQKAFTEQAQILDVVNGLPVDGIVGKQSALYVAQTNGFSRDAEQKLTKIMTDSWSIRRTTDEGEIAPDTLKNDSINAVVAQAKAGINANTNIPDVAPEPAPNDP